MLNNKLYAFMSGMSPLSSNEHYRYHGYTSTKLRAMMGISDLLFYTNLKIMQQM